MSIRLLGGIAQNFEIKTPKNFSTRPTLSLLKRKIFDRFQDWSQFRMYDLFGGTGSISFEAASRGCKSINIYEINPKAYKYLIENKRRLLAQYELGEINIYSQSCLKEKNIIYSNDFDNIFYIDPPFDRPELYPAIFNQLIQEKGILMIEGDNNLTGSPDHLIANYDFLKSSMVKVYQKGSHYIIVCKPEHKSR